MANSSVLEGKANIKLDAASGSIKAGGGNYILDASAADIANYAREGADLVVEFANGQRLIIRDFFQGGAIGNNLVLSNGEVMQIVDFSAALNGADGISEAAIAYSSVAAGGANTALLGLLGLAAAGVGVAVAIGGGDSHSENSTGSDNAANSDGLDVVTKIATARNAANKLNDIIKEDENIKDFTDIKAIKSIDGIDKIIDDISTGIDYIKDDTSIENIDAIRNMIKGVKAFEGIEKLIAEIEANGGIENIDGIEELIKDIHDGIGFIGDIKDIAGIDSVKDILKELGVDVDGRNNSGGGENPDEKENAIQPGPETDEDYKDDSTNEFTETFTMEVAGSFEEMIYASAFSAEPDEINLDEYLVSDTQAYGFAMPSPVIFSPIEEDLTASMLAASQIIV